ncbi:MAG: DNA-processing protein DprA [Tannerella sp.]|jgi:DNA processing protein|nr:DNA-processing protein DprA [Tannerella sp.]
MTTDKRILLIALTLIKGVGSVLTRHLLQYFGEIDIIFSEKRQVLEKVPGIGIHTAEKIVALRTDALKRAEQELAFVEKNKIRLYSMLDDDYPIRLRECQDAPVVCYVKGNVNLNAHRILSVVGTRNATDYGRQLTASLIKELSDMIPGLLIVSGLAYGIDICAHRSALKNGLPTVGVLAHGLDRIYPTVHRGTAIEMIHQGGLLTDFINGTSPERENFLQRNRLIAGLADATIVVESAEKGGALVTADIALSYGREVYAFPGRISDAHSQGCNRMIQTNKAGLITSARDLILGLCWDTDNMAANPDPAKPAMLPFKKERPDHPVITMLSERSEMQINEMAAEMNLPVHQLSTMLFALELDGHIKALPGGIYKLNP